MIVRGVEPDYTNAVPLFSVAEGRFISQFDVDHSRDVIVIGQAIAEALFPHVDRHRQNGAPERPPVRGDRRF